MNVGFVGSSDTARLVGVQSRRNSFQVGAGVKVNTGRYFDFFVNYDLNEADGFTSHNASLGMGVDF
jgi:uncharacterized protein with beta-barrel porin domain